MTDLSAIQTYVYRLHSKAYENYPQSFDQMVLNRTHLNDIKVKMEQLLSQTDIKEESKNASIVCIVDSIRD